MSETKRQDLMHMSSVMHSIVEHSYFHGDLPGGPSATGVPLERQRLLLADMALHLFQTAIKPGEIDLARLRDNLHAVSTVAGKFLPEAQRQQGPSMPAPNPD